MSKKFNIYLRSGIKSLLTVQESKYEERDFGIIVIIEEEGEVWKYTIPWENISYVEEWIS